VRSKKEHGLLLKVDFHKAFDSILWEHIDTSMGYIRGVQKNRITEKTEKTDGKLTEKTEPR
jgi:hypothetical protein